MTFRAYREDGTEVRNGDEVTDFRGDTAIFVKASRAREGHRTGKVVVKGLTWDNEHEYYDTVFSLTVLDI